MKERIYTNSTDPRQHKPQGRAAFTAVQQCFFGQLFPGDDGIAVLGAQDFRTQGTQTIGGKTYYFDSNGAWLG